MRSAMMRTARGLAVALGLAVVPSGGAGAGELRILTSFPPAMTDPFIAEFRRRHPGTEILVLNKNTNSALSEILRGNSRHFDLFWSSAPEPFSLIATRAGFDAAGCAAAGPAGHAVFAYSSIGWVRRADSAVFMPGEWNDLLLPVYRGKLGMALPSRSGTTHMMVERFLQVRGWNEGWTYFLRLSENLATISARSFGVIDGVESGRFDIGLSIDFLATAHPELEFRYGEPVMVFPAQIGLLAGAAAPALACDFFAFVASEPGQKLLLSPEVGRIPASDAIRAGAGPVAVPEALEGAIRRSWQGYDAGVAQARYWVVNMIFDLVIAENLPRRRDLYARIRALEGQGHEGELAALRRELATLPVDEADTASETLNAQPGHAGDLIRMTEAQRDARTRWGAAATAQLDAVAARLDQLEAGTP